MPAAVTAPTNTAPSAGMWAAVGRGSQAAGLETVLGCLPHPQCPGLCGFVTSTCYQIYLSSLNIKTHILANSEVDRTQHENFYIVYLFWKQSRKL